MEDVDPLTPAPLDPVGDTDPTDAETPLVPPGGGYALLPTNTPREMLNKIGRYILRRLLESTTWIGVFVSYFGIPEVIEDPVTQLVVSIIAILFFFVKREGSQAIQEERERQSESQ